MEQEKINKIVELSKKKEALESLFETINREDVCLQLRNKNGLEIPSYSNTNTASPYLKELHKRFVTMVLVDITDIETELESL